jgi:hypothetical protein
MAAMASRDDVGKRGDRVVAGEPRIQVDARRSHRAAGEAKLAQTSVELEPLTPQPLPRATFQAVS